MKQDDLKASRPSQKAVDQDDGQDPSARHRSEFGLAVLIMAALALGALRRRLARSSDRIYSQKARDFVWWNWRDSQSDGAQTRETQQDWDEYFEEELGKERIKRMHQAYNRAKGRNTRSYEKWEEHPRDSGSEWEATNSGSQKSSILRRAHLLRHYEVLGLDPKRPTRYTQAELKAAFREKAKEHHPDRNVDHKEESEHKFREVVESYEALRASHKPN